MKPKEKNVEILTDLFSQAHLNLTVPKNKMKI